MGYYYFDRTYFLIVIGLLITMAAQARLQKTFAKYNNVKSAKNVTGVQTADYILKTHGYEDISIKRVGGSLSDYFNPATKQVALSDSTANKTSVAAVAVAAHECGHVIQYKQGYFPLRLKSAIVPAVNFGSRLSFPLIMAGVFLGGNRTLINAGIFLFSFALIFQLVTLPVEIDASNRAIAVLERSPLLEPYEIDYAKDMLKAAAFTYIAAALSTALQFLRLILLFGNRRDD